MALRPKQGWLQFTIVVIVVFIAALSLNLERWHGWGFLLLCFVLGSTGGLAVIWLKDKLLMGWSRLSKSARITLVVAAVCAWLIGIYIVNSHTTDEAANDVIAYLGVAAVLLLVGLYRVLSRLLDGIWARFSNR